MKKPIPSVNFLDAELDFYFSKKHLKYLRELSGTIRMPNGFLWVYKNNYFKGVIYTECIDRGCTPFSSNFDDLVLLGTGTINKDVTHK